MDAGKLTTIVVAPNSTFRYFGTVFRPWLSNSLLAVRDGQFVARTQNALARIMADRLHATRSWSKTVEESCRQACVIVSG
jgi:hypothetical protein